MAQEAVRRHRTSCSADVVSRGHLPKAQQLMGNSELSLVTQQENQTWLRAGSRSFLLCFLHSSGGGDGCDELCCDKPASLCPLCQVSSWDGECGTRGNPSSYGGHHSRWHPRYSQPSHSGTSFPSSIAQPAHKTRGQQGTSQRAIADNLKNHSINLGPRDIGKEVIHELKEKNLIRNL